MYMFGKPSKGPTVAAAGARPTVAAAIGDGEDPIPVCSLPSALPALEAPSCPEGTTSGADADGNFHCWGDCSQLNTKTITYSASPDGTQCLPNCPAGSTIATTNPTSVTCAMCPSGYTYIAAKKACFETCGVNAQLSKPVAYDATAPPMCAARCPALFPREKSATQCANAAGRTTPRAYAVRKAAAVRTRVLLAAGRPEEALACREGTAGLEDDAGVLQCYSCDDGQTLTQDSNGYAVCARATCADNYNRCGVYCWNQALSDGIGFWQEDYCAAFMDSVVGCMPACEDVGL
ncbi:hypothetical protein COHA_002926 [Chlorella ohadii]|uniref:Uncharacterized protein n=1 Tax=Chlorella ohadii TaxID=2649997 RepID=A0AAD5DW16_9CHLO|nr:hypothetical protein COHA_002926 [Chlorella ohadii]